MCTAGRCWRWKRSSKSLKGSLSRVVNWEAQMRHVVGGSSKWDCIIEIREDPPYITHMAEPNPLSYHEQLEHSTLREKSNQSEDYQRNSVQMLRVSSHKCNLEV